MTGLASAAWECETAHFQVISEADPDAARTAAGYLESVRQLYGQLGLAGPPKAGRGVVLLFSERQSLHPYLPHDARDAASVGGLALRGQDQDWIAVVWDPKTNPRAALAHEYAHLLRDAHSEKVWFREGFSEYLASLAEDHGAAGSGPTSLRHLRSLAGVPWIPWDDLLNANALSRAFSEPTFYAQAWLAVSWLAAQGYGTVRMSPADLEALLTNRGRSEIETELEKFWFGLWQASLQRGEPEKGNTETAAGTANLLEVRAAAAWRFPYWKAEFHRDLDHWAEARPLLEALELEFPERPEPSESLGAIALSRGQYALAEEKLRIAILKGSQRPATHHQYSLMLLSPLDSEDSPSAEERSLLDHQTPMQYPPGRIGRAIWHARFARLADPDEPRYLLGEAQALSVAGEWDAAARLLAELLNFPDWQERAESEFVELLRRRSQIVRGIQLPSLRKEGGPLRSENIMSVKLPAVPRPSATPKPPFVWPPPGTVLLYGYIKGVECRDQEKIVRVRAPRFTVELIEKQGKPAKLYHPPKKLTELQCGMSGFEVNVVYRPLPAGSAVTGELVAVVF